MHDERNKSFAEDLMKGTARRSEADESRARERQNNAFSLNFRYKDGRRRGGISWGQYVNHEWEDTGDKEVVSILMGLQNVRIEGYNLEAVLTDIESGQLKRIKERSGREVESLRLSNPENEPVITRIEVTPSHQEMVRRLMEEEGNDTGFARRVRG